MTVSWDIYVWDTVVSMDVDTMKIVDPMNSARTMYAKTRVIMI